MSADRHARLGARMVAAMFVGHVVLFGAPVASWWPEMRASFPHTTNLYDAQLIVWVLAWVSHALSTHPGAVFDANINWPAPIQLTGSEHFFSHQIVFGPLWWATANPLLAANVTTWLWYPAGATIFAVLAHRCGASVLVAWACGCLFALGPLRAQLSLQTLQYPNALLPLLALALSSLREQPAVGRGLAAMAAILLALLASLYSAVLAVIGAGLWTVIELMRPLSDRRRFIQNVGLAMAIALVVAAVVLMPYLTRAVGQMAPSASERPTEALLWGIRWDELVVVGIGIAGWIFGSRTEPARRLLIPGTLFVATALVVLFAQPLAVRFFGHSPLAFVQGWHRFSVLGGFGTALLAAGGLQIVQLRWGVIAGRVAVGMLLLGLVAPRLVVFATFESYAPPSLNERAGAYRAVASIVAREGAGPLLELPWKRPGGARGDWRGLPRLEPDSMLGSTLHWLPLLGGYTRYPSPHLDAVGELVGGLPAPDAFEDLIEITHVEWILLRPQEDWPSRLKVRDDLRRSPFVGSVHEVQGFALLHVKNKATDGHWIQAIRSATIAPGDFSRLGTPCRPLDGGDAVAVVRGIMRGERLETGQVVPLRVTVRNLGSADWPATRVAQSGGPDRLVVHLEEAWKPVDVDASAPPVVEHRLRRDMRAGESIQQPLAIRAPARPGIYDVVLRIAQSGSAGFGGPPSAALVYRYRVEARTGPASTRRPSTTSSERTS